MKQKKILMSSYLLSLSLSVLGAFLKIVHSPYGEFFLVASALFAIVFIVLALKEIWMSNRIDIISPCSKRKGS
jgi:putative copper export protein